MSRLFYHVMQDNLGNLLFDVTGTMRIAGSGTLATIYGDEALTVILPNPMTNHPSFGSFKCFLGAGDYDFYMAKSGYTFETLTGVQGHGTMAQQDAHAVVITGGRADLSALQLLNASGNDLVSLRSHMTIAGGANRYNLFIDGNAPNYLAGNLGIGAAAEENVRLRVTFDKSTHYGVKIRQTGTDTGSFSIQFNNVADSLVGSITTTGSATAYNTSSDGRLKHAIAPLAGALDVLAALRPVAFRWKADDAPGVGFVAQEAQAVVPGAVTGAPDAVDQAGQIIPQQMDHSKLVPWLVSAVQALAARVVALETAQP